MKAPKPSDPIATAGAQAGQNTLAANANTIANSGTVTNPYGVKSSSLEYVPVMNPLTGKMESVARNNTTETLAPGQQAIFDQNQSSDLNLAKYGNSQTQELNKLGASPFQYNTGDHEQWFAKNYDTLNSEGNMQADEALRSRMAAQGIKQGSAAYDREMKSQSAGQGSARLQALMNAQGQGFQQSLATRNQRFNEPLAISSGTQLQTPNFNGANVGNVGTVDYAGIRANYDNQRMNRYQANQSMYGGLFSGLGSAFALSDRRAKKDIEKVGTVKGQNVYEYRYKGQDKGTPKTLGVMAQELMKTMPDAVAKGSDGLFRVNYTKAFSLGA
jgi:hypothetical protein